MSALVHSSVATLMEKEREKKMFSCACRLQRFWKNGKEKQKQRVSSALPLIWLAMRQGEVYICGKKREGLISDQGDCGLRIGLVRTCGMVFHALSCPVFRIGSRLLWHCRILNGRRAWMESALQSSAL